MDLLSAVAGLLDNVSELGDALDQGTTHVVHILGEILDDYLQTVSPPYALAVSVCGVVPECTAETVKLRDKILYTLLEAVGIISLIDEIVALWRAVPREVKQLIKNVAVAFDKLGDVFDDPSVANIAALAGSIVTIVTDLGGDVIHIVRQLDAGQLADQGNPLVWLTGEPMPDVLSASFSNPALGGPLTTIEHLFNGDFEDMAESMVDTASSIIKGFYCLFANCEPTIQYHLEYDWFGLPFLFPSNTLAAISAISGARGSYLKDPKRYCFWNKASVYPVVKTELDALWALTLRSVPSNQPEFDFVPGRWLMPDRDELFVATRHMPGAPPKLKEKAIAAVYSSVFSANGATMDALVADIRQTPDGDDPHGLGWLLGPGGEAMLDALYLRSMSRRGSWGGMSWRANAVDFNVLWSEWLDRKRLAPGERVNLVVSGGRNYFITSAGPIT